MSKPQTQPSDCKGPTFRAENCRYLDDSKHEAGTTSVWSADIVAASSASPGSRVFNDVLFAEEAGVVWICGIEQPDGRPTVFEERRASLQQEFIEFLRGQTAQTNASKGLVSALNTEAQFRCELSATFAYAVARNIPWVWLGVGYMGNSGYVCVSIQKPRDWLESVGLVSPAEET